MPRTKSKKPKTYTAKEVAALITRLEEQHEERLARFLECLKTVEMRQEAFADYFNLKFKRIRRRMNWGNLETMTICVPKHRLKPEEIIAKERPPLTPTAMPEATESP